MSGGFAAVPCMSQIKNSEHSVNFKNKANVISVVLGRFYHCEKREEEEEARRKCWFADWTSSFSVMKHLCCVWPSKTWVVEPSLLSARGPPGDKYFVFNHLVRTICQAFHRSACSQLVGSQRCQRVRVKCALWKPVDDLGPSGMPKKKKKKGQ